MKVSAIVIGTIHAAMRAQVQAARVRYAECMNRTPQDALCILAAWHEWTQANAAANDFENYIVRPARAVEFEIEVTSGCPLHAEYREARAAL